MKKSIIIALLAAMPLLAQEAPTNAPEAPAPGPRPEMNAEQKAAFEAKMLEKFDANKDGQLDDQEKEAMKADFAKHHGPRGDRGPRPEGKCCCGKKGPRPEMSEEQKAEFKAKMLEKFDANKDGQLDDQEKEAMKADFEKHHGPRAERGDRGPRPDGKCCCGKKGPRPEMSEEQKAEFKAKMLEKFDANKDGQLDDQEKEAMKAEFKKHHGDKPCDAPKPEDAPAAPTEAPAEA